MRDPSITDPAPEGRVGDHGCPVQQSQIATAPWTPAATLPLWFEQQVLKTPAAPAVVFGDHKLTFEALNAAANRLAHFLVAHGTGPEQRVAIALPRGVEQLVAVLAVTKTGAAYLPIDCKLPPARVAEIIEDAAPLLTLASINDSSWLALQQVVLIDHPGTAQLIGKQSGRNLSDLERRSPLHVLHPAYVIFTSGSTGKPKGVVVSHAALCNYLGWARSAYPLERGCGAPVNTSLSFDLTVTTLLLPLLAGRCVWLVPEGASMEALAGLSTSGDRFSLLSLVPSQLDLLNESVPGPVRSALTGCMILGGETVQAASVARWMEAAPGVPVINEYGPTETVVGCTWHRVERRDIEQGVIPIGVPIANTRAHVLDDRLQKTADDEPGQLYIAGAGLARGYLNRRGLTSCRFVADPFDPTGGRLYRTGDIVRRRPDGVLEFLGRDDEQVKIRGFRIELGEIEAHLLQLHQVSQAVAVMRADNAGQAQLVAYVVSAPGCIADAKQIRNELAGRLPEYMVPAAIVYLPALPLTANGKIDKRVLPAPAFEIREGRAAGTATESTLAALFAEVLGVPGLSVEDNFFELGGHSLTATRLATRIRTDLGLELPLAAVFEHPTVERLAKVLPTLAPMRASLQPQERPPQLPLSHAQQRLWFLQELTGGSADYNLPLVLRLEGRLQLEALELALNDLVGRHESLRTRIQETDGTPQQHIVSADAATLQLPVVHVDEEDLSRRLELAVRRPFDLTRDLPIRSELFELGTDSHVLLILLHHIAGDGASMVPLLRDLSTAYAARSRKQAPAWQPLPLQYVDYALWQRRWLGSPEDSNSPLAQQAEYWTRALSGLPEAMPLASDRPRPLERSRRGARVSFCFDTTTRQQLLRIAREEHATLFMVLHAVLCVLLKKLGAGSDIAIGSAIAGRTDARLNELIGFFVNTLVLRTQVDAQIRFRELLRAVREKDLAAYQYQDLPFEQLVELINPVRSPQHHPLFQVMLVMQNNESGLLSLPGVKATELQPPAPAARFDLCFVFTEQTNEGQAREELQCDIEYACDLFDEATVLALARRLQRLCRQVTEDPNCQVSSIDLLDTDERRALLDTSSSWAAGSDLSLSALFERQAKLSPDAPALEGDGGVMSYRELDRRANQLARRLRRHGAGPERRVALVLPRSTDMVIAQLAVAKTGAAFIPLDPSYPAERLAFMLRDSSPHVVVSDPGCSLPTPLSAVRIDVHDDQAAAEESTVEVFPASVSPSQTAYVIYTSGSTGQPKAVVVTHAGIASLARSQVARFHVDQASRVLQLASPSFDASIMEMLMAFASGACLVIPPNDRLVGEALGEFLQRADISHALIPPAALASMPVDSEIPLEVLIVGGEACPPSQVTAWANRLRMINAYGPTESTACATISDALLPDSLPPIGRATDGTRLLVLDEDLQPVPPGVPGELYIGGPGLARGYLNRPSLTSSRFIADPFGAAGQRLYRSGDRVCRQADGQLQYLGRLDQQVKLRGFRVELGEIESCLLRNADLRQAVVIVREDIPSRPQLIAYVVAGSTPVDTVTLRRKLATELPEFMVPAAVVLLERIPVSANGKLDRKALPPPVFDTQSVRTPRSEQEKIIAGLFAQICNTPLPGLDDRFFDIGGDSISAIQLVRLARKAGLLITPADVFKFQSVEALAGAARVPGTATLAADDVAGNLTLFPVMHWWLAQGAPARGFYQAVLLNTPVGAELSQLQRCLQVLIGRHEALRLRLHRPEAQSPWQLDLLVPGAIESRDCLSRVDCSEMSTETMRQSLDRIARSIGDALDPEHGVMLRAVWFDRGGKAPGRLLLAIHHLAVDGVSWRILLPDLASAWQELASGSAPESEAPGTSLRRWGDLLSREAASPKRVAELPLWRKILAAEDPLLSTRRLDPRLDLERTAASLSLTLPPGIAGPLLTQLPARTGASVNEILLTALALAAVDWRRRYCATDARGLRLDVEGHGREDIATDVDLSRTVGWFTSVYPVHLDLADIDVSQALSGQPALGAALGRVREQLRHLPDHGIGYGLLRYLNAETARSLAGYPPSQLAFNYLGQFQHPEQSNANEAWSLVAEAPALMSGSDPAAPLLHAIECECSASNGVDGVSLVATWTWAGTLFTETSIRDLAQRWFDALGALAGFTGSVITSAPNNCHHSLAEDLDQAELDRLESLLADS